MRRTMFAITSLVLVAATPAAGLRPGLWQVATSPGTATLDGRPLSDLPYTAPTAPDQVCLTAAQAAAPAAWFAHDAAAGCTFTRERIAGGKIDMAGTCPPQAPGLAGGTVHLTGSWQADRYTLRFATINPGENGRMGFTGTTIARRVGDCAA